MAIYGANKSNSARQVVMALARDCKPITIRHKGVKTLEYRGYTIKVSPPMVNSDPDKWCVIGKDDIGLAFRRGIANAKLFVDSAIAAQQPKIKCKVKRIAKPILDCAACDGSGMNRNGKLCRICSGKGTK